MRKENQRFNGVNVNQLSETIDHIKNNPDLANFKFRATNEWIEGAHSRTRIQSFYGAGQEDSSRKKPFIMEGDEPPVLLGENNAANAVEAVLHALTSCLSVGFIYNAAAKGIKVEELEMDIEGEIDLHGFLGLSKEVRPGYKNIEVTYRIQCDASDEEIEELCNYTQETSPVLDIIENEVPVSIVRETVEV